MIINNNFAAQNALRNYRINTDNKAKSSKKLSTGYRINSAADDAAGLSISEKMREQIRGLDMGTKNATDGISLIQVGDGALGEVQSILHRMKELTIQSLNDTNTAEDKAALQMEFDALQSEIDRITGTTQFNTKNIFSEHQPQYSQYEGNVYWQNWQRHAVNLPDNTLIITYELEKGGAPIEKIIEIPEGVYTTQELIDEIDDAMNTSGASLDGLNMEYTDNGTCNLNLEGGADIKGVSGGLSYLLNDVYGGASVGALIGTTVFASDTDRLQIKNGQNDSLTFQIMDFSGNTSSKSITIPEGRCTRQEIIDFLNRELSGTPIEAVKYSTGIKLQSDEAMITGFKGNMFKIDTAPNKVYTSVFYDNVMYGNTTAQAAVFTGGNVLTNNTVDEKYNKFKIDSSNNELTLSANGGSEVTITIPDGSYSASAMMNKLNELFEANNLDITADFYTSNGFSGFKITSNVKGVASDIDISNTSSAYATLFTDCNYTYFSAVPSLINETTPDYPPVFTGGKDFQTSILPFAIQSGVNDKFNIKLQGTTYQITMTAGSYNSLNDIVNELDNQLNGAGAPAGYKDKIVASVSNNKIVLTGANGSGLTSIEVSAVSGNSGYEELFVGKNTTYNTAIASNSGTSTTPAKITTNTQVTDPVTFAGDNNRFTLNVNGTYRSVIFPVGSLSQADVVDTINNQLKEEIVINNNTFSTIDVKGSTTKNTVSASGSGTTNSPYKAYSAKGSSQNYEGTTVIMSNIGAKVTMDIPVKNPLVIDDTNNKFTLSLNTDSVENNPDGKTETITLTNGSYTPDMLRQELQNRINETFGTGEGSVTVSLDAGKLVFTSKVGNAVVGNMTSISFDTSSSFIKELNTTRTAAKATTNYNLSDSIVLDGTNNTFNFAYTTPSLGTRNVSLTLDDGTYNANTIVSQINAKLSQNGIPVTASNDGGRLALTTNGVGTGYSVSYNSNNGGTSTDTLFGNLIYESTVAATADCSVKSNIDIDDSTNVFNIKVDGVDYSVNLDNGSYTRSSFVSMLNQKLTGAGVPVSVSLTGNYLRYTANNKGQSASIYMSYANGGSSMKAIYGETTVKTPGVTATFVDDKLVLTGVDNGGSLRISSNYNGSVFQTHTSTTSDIMPSSRTGYISSSHSKIDGVNISAPIVIDQWNKQLKFTYKKNGMDVPVNIELNERSYSYDELAAELQNKLDNAVGANELQATVNSSGVVISAFNTGSNYQLNSFSGGFYNKVLGSSSEVSVKRTTNYVDGEQKVDPAYTIGRKDIRHGMVNIESGVNDRFTFDITYGGNVKTISVKLDEESYSGSELVTQLQDKIDGELVLNGLPKGMIETGIGGVNTGVVGANDDNALCLKLSKTVQLPYQGEYIIDGVRGDAAFFIFYQSDGEMIPAYVKGAKDITKGVSITPENNVLSFDVDGTNYSVTLDEGDYESQELLDMLNQKFSAAGIPTKAKIEGKNLQISYGGLGQHKIDNISGTAKGAVFYQENSGDGKSENIMLQLSSNAVRDSLQLDKTVLNTVTMGINSVVITKNKYANKALGRIDKALDIVSAVRSGMGAEQNRLEHVISGNNNNSENTQAAESRLRDADMAKEMVKYSRDSILQQSAQAMIAQANSMNERVLSLLQ